MKNFLSLITFVIISINVVFAVPARPVAFNVLQKNGTEISVRLNGDEYFHFKTTEDGILITENSNGIFEYAKMNEKGEITATGILAKNKEFRPKNEISFINTLNNNVGEISARIRQERAETKKSNAPAAIVGEKGIAILVNFSDKAFVTPNANISFTNLLNQTGYSANNAIGSARDYFIACSNSAFKPNFDVYGTYTLPQTLNYYGQNDSQGYDMNAGQMVIDACNLAYAAGVNFSQYDTNGDGYVDNVFIFYAGYGEASGGAPANTIWPHRSQIYPLQVGSVKVRDYACGSELKGFAGSTMDGIGTFCHEFSHVLGLPDLYNTSGIYESNLDNWDIMDGGCYNGPGQGGDIPAMYSAYEMFYVGWLVPEILSNCGNYSLSPLEGSTKKAYIVTQNNTHNLNGQNPNPTLFYMLENRQKTSFDSYLPGSGLLITRINYNSSKWYYNTVNNSTPKGVAIMKAGTSPSGTNWAFPYASINSFTFTSINGASWGKQVAQIQKSGQNINFYFDCATGVSEIKDNEFEIINSSSNWYISMNYGNYLMEIYSMNGMLLKTFNFTNEISIAKSDFTNGVYLLKINDLNNNKFYFSKAIK